MFALAGVTFADEFDSLSTDEYVLQMRGAIVEQAIPVGLAKADVDTIYLLGGPDRQDGRFETSSGAPDWHGWISEDFTNDGIPAWHISTDWVISGSRTMVCGVDWDLPGDESDFGYGNNWNKFLVFTHDVPDPNQPTELRLTGSMIPDTEADYDYVYLEVRTGEGWVLYDPECVWDGPPANPPRPVDLDYTVTLGPEDYVGPGGTQAQIRFFFDSDVYWADEDQLYDSNGACWVDDLSVSMNGTEVDYEDFEDDDAGLWAEIMSPGVGDYAALYQGLHDLDPCRSNSSVQVAFIDNGVVVPGTGGSNCITWCYGPDGYVVNSSGGLLGGMDDHLENGIISPPMEWVETCDAAQLTFGVYVHEDHTPSSTGVHYIWYVRSTTSPDPNDLEAAPWQSDGVSWYGDASYFNHNFNITSFLEPGRQWFQVILMAWESGYMWDYDGADGTPAPYFDNVRVFTYPFAGPAINYHAVYMAQDNFPASGDLDFANLADNSVRFDMARNISIADHQRNDPGDSLTIDVVPVRAGSSLLELPKMVVRMKANPLFDAVRVLPPGFSQTGNIIEGMVEGYLTFNNQEPPTLIEDRYNFDLPDTGFFYPGDVIHYFFEAKDNQAGDIGVTLLPGDTTGFASFEHNLQYPSDFICRALPSLQSASIDDQPKILLWNDFANRGGENEWYHALNGAGLTEGVGYDIFYTNRPDAGVGNGLGGRATSAVLDGYDILLYSSGDLFVYTLGYGDFAKDPSRDLQLLDAWFARGGKKAFMTGDDLLADVSTNAGSEGLAFMNNYVGVEFIDHDLYSFLDDQSAPEVNAGDGNAVFSSCDRWIAYGGCLGINSFDAVETRGSSVSLAEFTDANGNTGVYPYTAGVYHYNDLTDTEIIVLPYDFMYIYNAPGYVPPGEIGTIPARSVMLRDVLNFFGMQLPGPIAVDDLPDAKNLAVSSYPNPFNPKATIVLSMPRAGHVSLKIFNVRGELVTTLLDGAMLAGVHELVWDGRDRSGAASSSGVYFAETKALDQTRVVRMAMIK